jgi:cell division protein FtsL
MLATKSMYSPATAREIHNHQTRHQTQSNVNEKTSRERLKWMGTILFCTVVLCGILAQYSVIQTTNLDVERLKIQVDQQLEKNAKLNDKVNELSSSARITKIAQDMGMVSTNPGVIARVDKR